MSFFTLYSLVMFVTLIALLMRAFKSPHNRKTPVLTAIACMVLATAWPIVAAFAIVGFLISEDEEL